MKSFLSIKPGATFFLGSSQTLVYHKDSIEVIYRYQSGKKSFYTHVYMYIVDDTKVTLYADWGDYFLHLDSITQIDHFDGIMKRPCPTFVEILTNDDFEKAGIMSMNGKETMGCKGRLEWQNQASRSPILSISSRWHCQVNREEPQALYRDLQELSSETLERPPGSRLG